MKWDGIEDVFGVEISVNREWCSKNNNTTRNFSWAKPAAVILETSLTISTSTKN